MEDNKFEFVTIDAEASEHISAPVYSYWKSVLRTFLKSKFAVFMLIVAIFITVFSLIQPMFSGYSAADAPYINDFSRRFIAPCAEHPFGTDHIGNSLFDAVWAACGTSLKLSTLVTAINMVIGIVVGAIWGYSKKVDIVMMEVYNIFANIPYTLFLIIMMYVLGQGTKQMIFAMTCTGWLGIAYFIRVQVMI
ncbi:MAG: ABC transporter permease, partial [Erysipelotrichales bacterium]|nr:ABC transporter permease [Erysipelotrichales bacterium]